MVRPRLPHRVRTLSSGKFVVFGNVGTLQNREAGAVHRYHEDGSYDPSFQVTGLSNVTALVETGSGFIVAGNPNRSGRAAISQVMRLNSDGSVDPTFDENATCDGTIAHVVVQPDGRILVAGEFTRFAGASHVRLARLLPSGAVDPTFSAPTLNGLTPLIFGGPPAVQADGRIILTGNFTSVDGTGAGWLARLNADGTRDRTFAPSGFAAMMATGAAVFLPNGQIIVAGRFSVPASYASNPTGWEFNWLPLVRINPDGSADESFGCFDLSRFGSQTRFSRIRHLAVQADGKMVAIATRTANANPQAGLVFKFDADGRLDAGFEAPQFRLYTLGTSSWSNGQPSGVAVESTGSVLISGTFNSVNVDGVVQHGVARLAADGLPLPWAPEIGGVYEYPATPLRMPDGSTWVTGALQPNAPQNHAFPRNGCRLLADGSYDFSFDLPSIADRSGWVFAGLARVDAARVFFWGFDSQNSTHALRIFNDGTPDPSFTVEFPRVSISAHPLPGDQMLHAPEDDVQMTVFSSLGRSFQDGSSDYPFHQEVEQLVAQKERGLNFALMSVTVGSYPLASYPDGKILYHFLSGMDRRFRLLRLNSDGTRDPTFAETVIDPLDLQLQFPSVYDPQAGQTVSPPGGVYTATRIHSGAEVLPDGSALIGGSFTSFGGVPARGLVKLQPDGTVDGSFNVGGGAQWTTLDEAGTRLPAVEAVHRLPNGMLLAFGAFEAFDGVPAPGVVLLRSNGSVVTNFTAPVTRVMERTARAKLLPQPDGSLLLSGPYRFAGQTFERSIVRLVIGEPLSATSAVSRKTHGAAGTFDVPLPLSGRGMEPRAAAAGGAHTIVVTFNNDLAAASASVSSGTGAVESATISGNTLTVQLTGVADQQTITVALGDVADIFGQALPPLQVQIGFLLGDTNGSGTVNASDIGETKASSGAAITAVNFRTDVNGNGSINATDVGFVKSRSGSTINAGDYTARAAR